MTTELVPLPVPREDIERLTASGTSIAVIRNAQEASDAADLLAAVQSVVHALEKARAAVLNPMRKRLEEARAWYDRLLLPAASAERTVKDRLLQWNIEQRNQAELAASQAAAAAGLVAALEAKADGASDTVADEIRLQVQRTEAAATQGAGFVLTSYVGDAGRATIRKTWTYEVLDPALVPREFLTVHGPAITQAIRSGVREIPGVRIFQKEDISGRVHS